MARGRPPKKYPWTYFRCSMDVRYVKYLQGLAESQHRMPGEQLEAMLEEYATKNGHRRKLFGEESVHADS